MTVEKYEGRPWRARFLRAPVAAFEYAERGDFVPLGTLADVALGAKTGADGFFFVKLLTPTPVASLGKKGSSRRVPVTGYSGWSGELSAGDLRPALLNPKDLQSSRGREFALPKKISRAYVFPAARPAKAGLADYIAAGERADLHKQQLVSSNATGDRWDRQNRTPISSYWALPYNSAYDYGAHRNAERAILNGRFVGVEPHATVDTTLLGAVLNSTFVLVTRLLEGVSTGMEAALDVGPPAARLLRVPNPNAFSPQGAVDVAAALAAIERARYLPPAPSRNADVDDLRRDLDTAVLMALGATAGEASYKLEELYRSYARWRASVEDVETRVRANRQTLASSGRDRSHRPVDLVGRQVWDELMDDFPALPATQLTDTNATDTVAVARDFRLVGQEPMMDAGMVRTPNGSNVDLGTWDRARYAAALIGLGFSSPLKIPQDPQVARQIADAIESSAQQLRAKARRMGETNIGAAQADDVAAIAVRLWRNACVDAGMQAET